MNTWYKDAVFYEVHVKSFYDSNGDGIGDFNGLTEKLEYLKDLGITCLWLLPFFKSPMRDDGYDISDYRCVDPSYGTMADFRNFLKKAHQLGLRVIADLVINHTSDQHPWFQNALEGESSPYYDYYVWSESPDKYGEARIIFIDTEPSNWTYSERVGKYYWHRFFSQQPDLNYENLLVQQEIFDIVEFWMDMGLDGFRVDAVPYLFEADGTNSENLPKTHDFFKRLRKRIDDKYSDKVLLAEANQSCEAVRPYFGNGDEFHMIFNFPLMPRLFIALRQGDYTPIVSIMRRTPPIPANCQWCTFLRNHDELTLEMVTDEERDFMYQEYAPDYRMRLNLGIRRRLAPLLDNDRRKIELLSGLLFSLPGSPIIYYGDEIGMGDNVDLPDRMGLRTPMQWTAESNGGFSGAALSKLYTPLISDPEYGCVSINVASQEQDSESLLNWMKNILCIRKAHPAFAHGEMLFVDSCNKRVFAFIRSWKDQYVLCISNLSDLPQTTELKLDQYTSYLPVDIIRKQTFPIIKPNRYELSVEPYMFYWFQLQAQRHA